MQTEQPKNSENNNPRRPSGADKSILRYTDLAFRMGVIIFLGTWAGRWLDGQYPRETPIFTLILSLLSVGVAMYSVIKAVSQTKK